MITDPNPTQPPRALEALLRRCLPGGNVGRCIIGDLRQEHAEIACNQNRNAANSWYRAQVLSLAPRYLLAKLGRRPRAPKRLPRRTSVRTSAMGTVLQDLRYAIRTIRKKPGFALTVIAIVALGVGASTTIFSVVDSVLLRKLPYPNADELVFFDNPSHPVPLYVDWRDRTRSFSAIAAAWDGDYDLTGDGTPESVRGALVTHDFFQILGARPLHGRLLASDDFVGMPPRVAVLGHGFWQRRWGGDPRVVGSSVTLNGYPVEVVGILEEDFQPPEALTGSRLDVWLPLDVAGPGMESRNRYVLSVVARLNADVSLRAAQADVDALSHVLANEYPRTNQMRDGSPRMYQVVPLHNATVGDANLALLLLLGASGLMLLIACANVANLFLARGTERSREVSVRTALGAGKLHIASQLLTESVVLALVGGTIGVVLAGLGVRAFELYNPGGIPRIEGLSVNPRVLGFAFGVSVVTGVLFGIAPAVRAARSKVTGVFTETSLAATSSRSAAGLRSALVVAEIAMSLVLLVGAGLLFSSLLKLQDVDKGFSTDNVLAMPLILPDHYTEQIRLDFARDVIDAIESIPGVEAAGAGSTLPPTSGFRCCWGGEVQPEVELEDPPMTIVHPVTPDYFDVIGATILRGRGFTDGDNDINSAPALVNETTAWFLFGEEDPVGESLHFGEICWTIVGVVNDIRHWGLHRESQHNVYVPDAIFGGTFKRFQVGVKTAVDAQTLGAALRQAVWSVDPDLPVPEVVALEARVSQSVGEPRFYSILVSTFATLSILLAAGGIYGSMLYSVGQRQKELGIRMALGARRANVVGMIVASGLVITTIGVVLGLGGAFAMSRVLESVLFGITATDPLTYVAVTALLCAVAVAACYLPARKASQADPVETLRAE